MFLKKHLGQNFLRDKNILAKEARLIKPDGRVVLEIGAGDGRLTEQLLLAGAKLVIAVEKDPGMAEILAQRFAGKPVRVLNADFLELDEATTGKVDKIAGNIPYYISSPIIFKLREFGFASAVLMVQDEFAKRMVAKPGSDEYGRLSVTSSLFYEVRYVQKVPRSLFIPVPKVDSAIIMLRKKDAKPDAHLERVILALFQHKNRTVRNALVSAGFPMEEVKKLGELLKKRPRELPIEAIKETAERLRR